MTVLATILGFWLLSWGLRRLTRAASGPASAPEASVAPTRSMRAEKRLSALQARYVSDDITLDELEAEIANALEHPPEPVRTEHVEVHVWNAPDGSALHLHL